MYPQIFDQRQTTVDKVNPFVTLQVVIDPQADCELNSLLEELSPDTPWGDRKAAALGLGSMGGAKAIQGLIDALPADPFWMVRYAIIQALVMVGDPKAVPALQDTVENDGFQVVRAYAAQAVKWLSRKD